MATAAENKPPEGFGNVLHYFTGHFISYCGCRASTGSCAASWEKNGQTESAHKNQKIKTEPNARVRFQKSKITQRKRPFPVPTQMKSFFTASAFA